MPKATINGICGKATSRLGDLKKFPLLFTVGRQAITYGDGRLVADSRWGNFGRTFDAHPYPLGKTILLLGRGFCHAPGADRAA